MQKTNYSVLAALLALSFSFSSFSVAATKTPTKLAEKASYIELTPKVIAKVKKQLNYIVDKSYKRGEDELKKTGVMAPYAAVIKPNGKVKIISISNKKMPAAFALKVLHDTLFALAHKGKIAASAIYYVAADTKVKKVKIRMLVIELEHSIGIGFVRITPFKVTNNKIKYTKSIETRMKKLIVMAKSKKTDNPLKKEKAIKE